MLKSSEDQYGGTEIPLSPQINYDIIDRPYPKYQYKQIIPIEGTSAKTLDTTTSQFNTFEVTNDVLNLHHSYITFDVNVTGTTAGRYIWFNCLGFPAIRDIRVYDKNGRAYFELESVNEYLETVLPATTSTEEMITNGLPDDEIAGIHAYNYDGHFHVVTPIAALATVTGGTAVLFNANFTQKLTWSKGGFYRPINATEFDATYSTIVNEPVRSFVSKSDTTLVAATKTAATIRYRVPLKAFKHSMLEKDIDMPVGDSLYIRINYEAINRIGFSNTSAVNPATGAGALINATVTNQFLVYAAEVDDIIRQSIFAKFNAGEFVINADHVERLELPETAQSTNVLAQFKIDPFMGQKLKKIYYTAYNRTADNINNNSFNHVNTGSRGTQFIDTYNTLLDNDLLQQFTIDCSRGDDYLVNKKCLLGSSLANSRAYKYGWLHIDDFSDYYAVGNRQTEGIPLTDSKSHTWSIKGTSQNIRKIHKMYAILERYYKITPVGVFWMGIDGQQL